MIEVIDKGIINEVVQCGKFTTEHVGMVTKNEPDVPPNQKPTEGGQPSTSMMHLSERNLQQV